MSKQIKNCLICLKEYTTYNKDQKYCTKKCMGIANTGEGNPNFGNNWSDEQRKHLSEYNLSISKEISNRVKKDWEGNTSRRENAAKVMAETFKSRTGELNHFYNKKHTAETLKIISEKSLSKFTPAYRTDMEDRGLWRKIKDIPAMEYYYRESSWKHQMWDIISNNDELAILNEIGIFNSKSNSTGAVRDHKYGRMPGFHNGVFPEILRHPCNCEIVSRNTNVRKFHKCNDISIKLEDLFNLIISYNKDWNEQETVIKLIDNYKQGKRWKH